MAADSENIPILFSSVINREPSKLTCIGTDLSTLDLTDEIPNY